MKNKKFLTVFAVFDDETQEKLKELQNLIIQDNNSNGTQTMDIPFHISLGSFPVNQENKLNKQIFNVCNENSSFDIRLDKIGFFGNKVVFAEPIVNEKLNYLHEQFNCNYADGFSWHAHSTLFIDDNEENVSKAKRCAIENFNPINAKIVEIQLGEFFPTRLIVKEKLKEEQS